MNVLVLNAGSSSLKFRLFQIDQLRSLSEQETVLADGQVERIGKSDATMTFHAMPGPSIPAGEPNGGGSQDKPASEAIGAESVFDAAREIVQRLTAPRDAGRAPFTIDAVGHRIVHGGPRFYAPVRIDEAVLAEIRELTELAPLHNPSGLAGIEAVRESLVGAANVAVFDTAFHHDLPAAAALYALPSELSHRQGLRRYGFHGISYHYVSERLLLSMGRLAEGTRVIICHLGSGASVCALRGGKSVDTSMGFTPLEGLIMGARCGDVDPGLLLHLLRTERMTVEQLDELLNRRSGLLGLSGISSDVRDLEAAAAKGDKAARRALECFAYRVRKYIGAYAAILGGVDALVFTGGIGEHSASMRAAICSGLDFLGLNVHDERNRSARRTGPEAIGAGEGSRVWIIPTDEERQIARETFALLG